MNMRKRFNLLRASDLDTAAPATGAEGQLWRLSVPAIVASVFGKLELERRTHILGLLLGSVGPLALAVIADGVFFKYFNYARWYEVPVSFEDAALASSNQVYDLVRYVEQSNPRLVDDLLNALLRDGIPMTAIGASFATIAIMRLLKRRGIVPTSFTGR